MTTALLTLLVLIELARLVLQYRSGKTYAERQEKTYCMASEVDNDSIRVSEHEIWRALDDYKKSGYELTSVVQSDFNHRENCNNYILFFTKKKVKNFTENG